MSRIVRFREALSPLPLPDARVKRQAGRNAHNADSRWSLGRNAPLADGRYLAHYRTSSVKFASEETTRRQLRNSLLVLITVLI